MSDLPPTEREAVLAELLPVIEEHPRFLDLCEAGWCSEPDILLIDAEQAARMREDSKGMRRVRSVLHHPDARVRMVIYMTSHEEPESFGGAGEMYHFFFHPYRPELLHVVVGGWRS